MAELTAALCANLICIGTWALMATGAGWLAHRRVRRVEAELGRRAAPADEAPLLFYAAASVVWVVAAILAVVGLVCRDWARLGRNCLLLLIGHFSVVTLGACGATLADAAGGSGGPRPLALVGMACAILFASAIAASAFLWRWGSERVRRLEAEPPTGPPPGAERWAVWLGALLIAAVGLVAPFVYRAPQNVRVGVIAARIATAQLLGVTALVCVGLPIAMWLSLG